jgi:chitinase
MLIKSKLSDEWADSQIDVDGQKGCLRALASLKQKYTHLKLILSIGGGGAASKPFPDISSSRSGRETFAKSAKKLIESFSFDGVDGMS